MPKTTKADKATKPSTPKDQKNGVTRPKDGSKTRKVWDIADKLGGVRSEVLKECAKRNINPATATTQFGKWRKYNGLEGRTSPKAAKKVKKAAKTKSAPPPPPPAAETTES